MKNTQKRLTWLQYSWTSKSMVIFIVALIMLLGLLFMGVRDEWPQIDYLILIIPLGMLFSTIYFGFYKNWNTYKKNNPIPEDFKYHTYK